MTNWLEHREDSAGSRTCWCRPCASDMLEVSEHRRSLGRVPCAVRELVQGMSDQTRAREAWKPQSKTFSRSRCTARDRQRGLTAFIRSRAHGTSSEQHHLQTVVWPTLSEPERALWRSHSGPLASSVFVAMPTTRTTRFEPQLFRVLLSRRLRLPLPFTSLQLPMWRSP